MTAFTELRTLRVPVEHVGLANALAYVADPDEGSPASFRAGTAATVDGPATHYACSVLLTPATAALLDDSDATNLHAAMLARSAVNGRPYAAELAETQALRDATDVYAGPLAGLLAEVGHVLVSTPEEA